MPPRPLCTIKLRTLYILFSCHSTFCLVYPRLSATEDGSFNVIIFVRYSRCRISRCSLRGGIVL